MIRGSKFIPIKQTVSSAWKINMASIEQTVIVDISCDTDGYSGKNLLLVVNTCIFMPRKPLFYFFHCIRLNQGGFGL